MLPLIPIIGWVVGGLVATAVAGAAMGGDDESASYDDSAERMKAAREAERRKREAKERRRQAEVQEAEADLERVRSRGRQRVNAAKVKAQGCRRRVDEMSSLARDLDEFLK